MLRTSSTGKGAISCAGAPSVAPTLKLPSNAAITQIRTLSFLSSTESDSLPFAASPQAIDLGLTVSSAAPNAVQASFGHTSSWAIAVPPSVRLESKHQFQGELNGPRSPDLIERA